jgi:diguanylate cyclase (GGDEF)-like protein/PAS domain S-box-containing protein
MWVVHSTMSHATDHRNRYAAFVRVVSAIVAAVGLTIITGWIAGIQILKSLVPGGAAIEFDGGAALLLSGLALGLLSIRDTHRIALYASSIASGAVVVIGTLTLIRYAGDTELRIAELVFPEDFASMPRYPDRMAAAAAMIFILAGAAMLMLAAGLRSRWVEGLTIAAMFNALIPAIGYLYGATALYRIPYYGTIALPVTSTGLVLCAGILAVRPDRGLMSFLTNESAGGMTARRLLPAAIFIPLVIDRLQYWGQKAGLYDATFGLVLFTLSSMAIFAGLIVWNARLLMQLDLQRGRAEASLRGTLEKLGSNVTALSEANARLQAEIHERCLAEERLFRERERAEVTLQSVGDGVITTDTDARIVYMNPIAEKLTGWSNAAASGRPIDDIFRIVDPVTRERIIHPAKACLHRNEVTRAPSNRVLIHRDGSDSIVDDSCAPIHDPDGRVIGAVLVFHDVSAVEAISLKMAHLAKHDSLTDLPNRLLLDDRLAQAITLALRHDKKTAVLLLDLDRFKHVNDMLGHVTGDRLLQEIARRAQSCVQETDTVSRQGGDEFVIVLSELADSMDAARIAAQLLEKIAQPYFIDGHEVHITVSIGISICPDDGENSGTMIKHADAAMYQAKKGRNQYQFFTRGINERAVRRFALEGRLRHALAREESALYYQPKMDIATGMMTGAEALLRWPSGGKELASPAQLIPIAEESGLIIPIGEWVLRKACQQCRAWQLAGHAPFPIAVNVSAVQFRGANFTDYVARILEETGLEPRYLQLELTESATMHDIESTIALLQSLRRMGIGLAIDDFGTGYSSLSYLQRFPIDTLKIDRSFVQDVTTDPDGAAITLAIISMAKSLKHKVVAEGVETLEQFEFLKKQGCDEIQGFYFSEPLPAAEFERRILRGREPLLSRTSIAGHPP